MLNAIYFYRVSRWLYLHHIPFLPKLITLLIFLIYNSKIPYTAQIGKNTFFAYGGIGVVLHANCVIGDNVLIGCQVTLGGGNRHYPGVPIIKDNVMIKKGAIVYGGVTIEKNSIIGANSVVNKPVPENSVYAGVPAKLIRKIES